jgi:hypothetical protein
LLGYAGSAEYLHHLYFRSTARPFHDYRVHFLRVPHTVSIGGKGRVVDHVLAADRREQPVPGECVRA